MGWYDHMNWGWGHGFMMIFWVLLLALLIIWFVRGTQGNGTTRTAPSESAMDVLKKRYARGELSKEEFEERKKDLA